MTRPRSKSRAKRAEAGHRTKAQVALARRRAHTPTDGTAGIAPGPGAWYDQNAAERVIHFAENYCSFTKGKWAGKPFKLQPWQKSILRRLFGWKRRDGRRWFRRLDLWIPRKNGKSELIAIIANYMLFADGEQAPEIYLCANDTEQAAIVFRASAAMIAADRTLSLRCTIYDSERAKSVVVPGTMGAMQAVSASPKNKDGLNISCVVFDEIHELRREDYYAKMMTGSAAREQPLKIVISTAGKDRNSLGYREYLTGKRILEGKSRVADRLVVIYEASADDDWTAEATWRKANPNLGITVDIAEYRSMVEEAKEDAQKEAHFKRYFLNIWVGEETGWVTLRKWDRCGGEFDQAKLPQLPCWIGLDLSMRSDLTVAVALFREENGDQPLYYVLPHYWVPSADIELKEVRDGVIYREFARQGLLTITDGDCTDYSIVRDHVLHWSSIYKLRSVCYDKYNATQIAGELQNAGLEVIEIPQSTREIAPPTMELKNLVLQRRLRHGDNPLLRWHVENVKVVRDPIGNERISKKSSTARVDGLVATVMALARASLGVQASVYEERGALVF